jgi:hypothetical protein
LPLTHIQPVLTPDYGRFRCLVTTVRRRRVDDGLFEIAKTSGAAAKPHLYFPLSSRGVPQMLPQRAQHHSTTWSLSLIFVARRAPHRVHGGAGDRASVSDMATRWGANYRPVTTVATLQVRHESACCAERNGAPVRTTVVNHGPTIDRTVLALILRPFDVSGRHWQSIPAFMGPARILGVRRVVLAGDSIPNGPIEA